jgi:hypothetical protein
MGASGGAIRAVVVIFGGLLALQASQDLDATKLVYFAAAFVAVAGSVRAVVAQRGSEAVIWARRWLIASMVLAVLIAISLPVAMLHGTSPSAWLRDAASYGLLAVAPWVALDLGSSLSSRSILALTIAGGGLASLSFAINWIQRRGMADLPIDRLVLPTFALATALFAVFVALSIQGRMRVAALGGAGIVLALLLITGTRTVFAILLIPVALLLVETRRDRIVGLRRSLPAAIVALAVAATIVLGTRPASLQPTGPDTTAIGSQHPGPSGNLSSPSSASQTTSEPPLATPGPGTTGSAVAPLASEPSTAEVLGARYGSIDAILNGQDQSLKERIAQTQAAWAVFVSAPVLGAGLGANVRWVNTTGKIVEGFTADTPVVVLAKFGILGLLLVGSLAWAGLRTIRDLDAVDGPAGPVARRSWIGFATGIIALTPFGSQLEDKGASFAVILLLGLAVAALRESGGRSFAAEPRVPTGKPIAGGPR